MRRNAIELDDGGKDNANPQKIKRWKQQRTKLMGDELQEHELDQKKQDEVMRCPVGQKR